MERLVVSSTQTSTMTTTYAHYIVAYPHPAIPPRERIQRLKVDTESSGERIVAELRGNYLEHSDDLKNPILRKVRHLLITRRLHSHVIAGHRYSL